MQPPMQKRFQGAPLAIAASVLALSAVAFVNTVDAQSQNTSQRPRIALVLGGGGARGAAHIGVLQVLEELRVPIDCVAGTSMGALVGAAYASGMSASEIKDLVSRINWSETFGTAGTRDLQSVHVKTGHVMYSNSFEFGWKRKGLLAPAGLVASQQIESILRSIVGRARYQESFDDLPIPFRAVATDVQSGEMHVFAGGDLAVAMRASMAVPGAFSAVQADGHVLVDGGLVRNLPVDIARLMCGDVVIASSLIEPQPLAENLESMLAIFSQLIDVVIKNNERAQLKTLTERDTPILISLPDMTSGDFDKVPTAIPLGAKAAHAAAVQLSRYSMTPADYAQWRASINSRMLQAPKTIIVNEIRVSGLTRVNPEVVEAMIDSRVGAPLTEEQIVLDAQRIFSRGDFEKVDYRIIDADQGLALEFLPLEKPLAPDYIKFDLGLLSSKGGDTGFLLRAEHQRTWVNALGGNWNNAAQIGRKALIETSFFQPLDLPQRFFVEPRLSLSREIEDLYYREDRVARYILKSLDARLDFGTSLDTWGEVRFGLRRALNDFDVDIGTMLLPESDNADLGGVTARFTIDTRDSMFLPTRGDVARLDVYASESWLGAEATYQRAELLLQHVFPFRSGMVYLLAGGGSDFGSEAPAYDLFRMRGIRQLAGFQFDELRGHEYALGRVTYLYKVTDLQTLLGQALYAGVTLEAGNMYERIDNAPAEGMIIGSSVMFGGRTPLGPLLIVLGYAEGGHTSVYLQIGRPLDDS
jgi:NTE family protein